MPYRHPHAARLGTAIVLAASCALVGIRPAGAQSSTTSPPANAPMIVGGIDPATGPAPSGPADPAAPPTTAAPTVSLPPLAPPDADAQAAARAQVDVKSAERALKVAQAAEKKAARALPPRDAAVAEAQTRLDRLRPSEAEAAAQLTLARGRLRDLAVGSYLLGGQVSSVNYLLEAGNPTELYRRRAVVGEVGDLHRRVAEQHQTALSAATADVEAAVVALEAARTDQLVAQRAHAEANQLTRLREAELEDRRQFVDLVKAGAPVGATDIPRLVLDAYQRAAAAMSRTAPGCGLRWTVLAGIGRVESNHGRYRGSSITLSGEVLPYIIGVPLDGSGPVALINDTDGGAYDGDLVYDRAVGPMQFIPSTWAFSKRDGNGDGFMSPHNIYDTALAAGAYLCRAAGSDSIQTEAGFHRAVYSYNHSEAYIGIVRQGMDRFEDLAASVPTFPGSAPGVRLPRPPPTTTTTTSAPAAPAGPAPAPGA